MTIYQFQGATKILIDVYGKNVYPQVRLDLLFGLVEKCDGERFLSFVKRHVMNSRQPLLGESMADFRNAENNGRDYSFTSPEHKLDCEICWDMGIVIATPTTSTGRQTLIIHDCKWGKLCSEFYYLPMWDKELEERYCIEQCYLSWFKPEPVGDLGNTLEDILEKSKVWQRRIDLEEKYWRGIRGNIQQRS